MRPMPTLFILVFAFLASSKPLSAPSLLTHNGLEKRQQCFDCSTRLASCRRGCDGATACLDACACQVAAITFCREACAVKCV
ncbi:hypothetical protein IAQ61_005074 [Plenodomus lingam]|uniref:uncharacterized protein n=1 Tax=Leptosphaeria maculans TaxID=5022 RepID=UPI0033284F2F|nr:hypothetical protein IAQ61_005074 [Plenodomus lingam]